MSIDETIRKPRDESARQLSVKIFGFKTPQGSEGYMRLSGTFPITTESAKRRVVAFRGLANGKQEYVRCAYTKEQDTLVLGPIEQTFYRDTFLVEERPYVPTHPLETRLLDYIAALLAQEKETLFSKEVDFKGTRLSHNLETFAGLPVAWREQWRLAARIDPDKVVRFEVSYSISEKVWNPSYSPRRESEVLHHSEFDFAGRISRF